MKFYKISSDPDLQKNLFYWYPSGSIAKEQKGQQMLCCFLYCTLLVEDENVFFFQFLFA